MPQKLEMQFCLSIKSTLHRINSASQLTGLMSVTLHGICICCSG